MEDCGHVLQIRAGTYPHEHLHPLIDSRHEVNLLGQALDEDARALHLIRSDSIGGPLPARSPVTAWWPPQFFVALGARQVFHATTHQNSTTVRAPLCGFPGGQSVEHTPRRRFRVSYKFLQLPSWGALRCYTTPAHSTQPPSQAPCDAHSTINVCAALWLFRGSSHHHRTVLACRPVHLLTSADYV